MKLTWPNYGYVYTKQYIDKQLKDKHMTDIDMNRRRLKWSAKLKSRCGSQLASAPWVARKLYPGIQKNKNSKQNIEKGEAEYIMKH